MDKKTRNQLMTHLKRDAAYIATHFGLRYRSIEAERANVTSRYGVCFSDGTIKIRLRHATTGKPLKYSSLVSTLCHELAHLRHFNHGLRFRAFNTELLEFARSSGIYRPAPVGANRPAPAEAAAARAPSVRPDRPERSEEGEPEQLSLF